MKKAIFLFCLMAFVAVCGVSCLTNPTDTTAGSGDSDTGSSVNPNADKYPDDDIYNGANYNLYTNEYNELVPRIGDDKGVFSGVGIINIYYEPSTRHILYSAGGAGSDKVEYNVILSTKGSSSMKTLTSDELNYNGFIYADGMLTRLATIASTVSISADTRIYIQFTKWINTSCDGVFYLGTFTPAEFNQ